MFGNRVLRFAIHRSHVALHVEAVGEVVHRPRRYEGEHPTWESVAELIATQRGPVATDVAPFAAHSRLAAVAPGLDELTAPVFTPGRSIIDAVMDLCHTIQTEFRFESGFSDVTTPVKEVLAARRGVCQDFAHLAMAALRSKGLAARYISGYVETRPPPGQPKLVGVDASHTWRRHVSRVRVARFDPTNDQVPPLNHVTVGWGHDYGDVAPVRGVVIAPAAASSSTSPSTSPPRRRRVRRAAPRPPHWSDAHGEPQGPPAAPRHPAVRDGHAGHVPVLPVRRRAGAADATADRGAPRRPRVRHRAQPRRVQRHRDPRPPRPRPLRRPPRAAHDDDPRRAAHLLGDGRVGVRDEQVGAPPAARHPGDR